MFLKCKNVTMLWLFTWNTQLTMEEAHKFFEALIDLDKADFSDHPPDFVKQNKGSRCRKRVCKYNTCVHCIKCNIFFDLMRTEMAFSSTTGIKINFKHRQPIATSFFVKFL